MHPAAQQWFSNDPATRQRAEVAAEELAARLETYAAYFGQPLTEFESMAIRRSFEDFGGAVDKFAATHTEDEAEAFAETMQRRVVDTVTKSIVLVRQAVEADKKLDMPTVEVRTGLRLPSWWQDRYEVVYQTGLMWALSAILQSAFLGAPELGETKPWMSP